MLRTSCPISLIFEAGQEESKKLSYSFSLRASRQQGARELNSQFLRLRIVLAKQLPEAVAKHGHEVPAQIQLGTLGDAEGGPSRGNTVFFEAGSV